MFHKIFQPLRKFDENSDLAQISTRPILVASLTSFNLIYDSRWPGFKITKEKVISKLTMNSLASLYFSPGNKSGRRSNVKRAVYLCLKILIGLPITILERASPPKVINCITGPSWTSNPKRSHI